MYVEILKHSNKLWLHLTVEIFLYRDWARKLLLPAVLRVQISPMCETPTQGKSSETQSIISSHI